jgi:hypothetical protein
MLSYCSSEAAAKEDKANSKADEIVVLSYCSLEAAAKEDKVNSKADETMVSIMTTNMSTSNQSFTRERGNLCDISLLNNFSVSRVAKSTDSSKAVIFIPHTELSRAYNNYLARSLSE